LPIEVKSGRNKGVFKGVFSGLRSFSESFHAGPGLLVGMGGVALEMFLAVEAEGWLG